MSQENVEIVRRIYASTTRSVPGGVALVSEPVEHWKSLIDPGIEWCGPREFPDLAASPTTTVICSACWTPTGSVSAGFIDWSKGTTTAGDPVEVKSPI